MRDAVLKLILSLTDVNSAIYIVEFYFCGFVDAQVLDSVKQQFTKYVSIHNEYTSLCIVYKRNYTNWV